MQKTTLFLFLLLIVQSLHSQNFSNAGLPWSKNCTTNKPFKKKGIYNGGSPITQAKLDDALSSISVSANEVKELIIQNGTFDIFEPITIPSNVLLTGKGYTEIHIKDDPGAGFKINTKTRSGIENMIITNFTEINCCRGSGSNFSIAITNSTNCWVKGVTSYYGGPTGHISISGGGNNEVSGCYIYNNRCAGDIGGGRAYGITLTNSNLNLVVHNVLSYLRHHILLNGTSQDNVIAYNKTSNTIFKNWQDAVFCDYCKFSNPFGFPTPSYLICNYLAQIVVSAGQIDFHGGDDANNLGPLSNLIEGNCLDGCIKYYKGNKGNNQGGDIIRFNTSNGNPIGNSDIIFETQPIMAP